MERIKNKVTLTNGAIVDNYRMILILTLISTFALLFVDISALGDTKNTSFGAVFVSAIVGMTLILSLHASDAKHRFVKYLRLFIVLSIVAAFLVVGFNNLVDPELRIELGGVSIIWVVIAFATPVIISRRILTHNFVDANTLMGAVSAYLQFAIAFCYAFMFIELNTADYFFGAFEESKSFMYFSLSTITTVGFGDLVSVNEVGRALSSIEAAFGQIFLVVLVAILVSRYKSAK